MTLSAVVFLVLGTIVGSLLALRLGYLVARRFRLYTPRKLGRRRTNVARKVPVIGEFVLTGGIVMGLVLGTPVLNDEVLLSAEEITAQLRALMGAVVVLWVGGLAIDRQRRMATSMLLLTHATAIFLLLAFGVRIRGMSLLGWTLPLVPSLAVTAVWLFLMMQFSRFLDGIDGLLPGVAILLAIAQMRIVWGHKEPYALTLGW